MRPVAVPNPRGRQSAPDRAPYAAGSADREDGNPPGTIASPIVRGPVEGGSRRGDPVVGSPRIGGYRLELGAAVDGAVDGVGVVGDEPPEPLPPMFGQFALLPVCFGRVDGVVEPPVDGWLVALGVFVADGSGLAAATTATPPTVSRPAARASVAIVRRMPNPRTAGSAGTTGSADPADAGWSFHSMKFSVLRWVDEAALT